MLNAPAQATALAQVTVLSQQRDDIRAALRVAVLDAHASGATFTATGIATGRTRQRIKQIVLADRIARTAL